MRSCFIEDHRNANPVRILYAMLEFGPSGYHAWRAVGRVHAIWPTAAFTAEIRQIHADNRAVYGSPRVHTALRARGRRVGVNRGKIITIRTDRPYSTE